MSASGYTVRRWSNGRNDSGWLIEDSDGEEIANATSQSNAQLIINALNALNKQLKGEN